MKVFGYWASVRRHRRGETRGGFYAMLLPGVGGFMIGLNAPIIGDCCIDVRKAITPHKQPDKPGR